MAAVAGSRAGLDPQFQIVQIVTIPVLIGLAVSTVYAVVMFH